MKKVFLCIFFYFVSNLAFCQNDIEYKEAMTRYMKATNALRNFKMTLDKLFTFFEKANYKISKRSMELLKDEFSNLTIDDLTEFYTDIYIYTFSAEELNKLSDFYETPLGIKYIASLPYIMEGNDKAKLKLVSKIIERMKAKLEDDY